jgi:flagellar basal body-associated protein FliL
MQKKIKILIIILVVIALVGVYIWYSSGNIKEEKAVVSDGVLAGTGVNPSGQTEQVNEILRLLSLVRKIEFDSGFLNSALFKELIDYSVQLPEPETGRNNPFSVF